MVTCPSITVRKSLYVYTLAGGGERASEKHVGNMFLCESESSDMNTICELVFIILETIFLA